VILRGDIGRLRMILMMGRRDRERGESRERITCLRERSQEEIIHIFVHDIKMWDGD